MKDVIIQTSIIQFLKTAYTEKQKDTTSTASMILR